MGNERGRDPGDDPRVQLNRMRLGFIGGPTTVLVAAMLWAAGLTAVAVVLAALGIAMAGAAVDAAARRSRFAGTTTHAYVLLGLAVLAVAIGLTPLAVADELVDARRGAATVVLGPVAGAAVAWTNVRRARRFLGR